MSSEITRYPPLSYHGTHGLKYSTRNPYGMIGEVRENLLIKTILHTLKGTDSWLSLLLLCTQ